MATLIDSLVVALGLDKKDFDKQSKELNKSLKKTDEQAKKSAKSISKSGDEAKEFFVGMRSAALKFFAVLTLGKGIVGFTKNVVSTGASLSRTAESFGESTDELYKFVQAAKLNGGSLEGLIGTIKNLNSQITDIFMKGEAGISPYLRQLGVSVTDAQGKAKKATQLLIDIADASEKAFPDKRQRFSFLEKIGLDEGTTNLLSKGGKELRAIIKAQQGFSDSDARAALKAEQTWIKAQQRLETLSREIVIKLLPSIERLTNSMVKMAEVIVPPLSVAADIFVKLDSATDGWTTNLLLALAALRLIGGTAVIGGLTKVSGLLTAMAGSAAAVAAPVGALLYSRELNQGEDEELKRIQGKYYSPVTTVEKPKGPGFFDRVKDKLSAAHERAVGAVGAGMRGMSGGGPIGYYMGMDGGPMTDGTLSGAGSMAPVGSGDTTVSVGNVNVYTQATDAKGIAASIKSDLVRQFDGGLR